MKPPHPMRWEDCREKIQIIEFLEQEKLPEEESTARRLALERPRFTLVGGVLYLIDAQRNNRLRLAVPTSLRKKLLEENHSGRFSGRFAERGLYETLVRRFWWDGMRAEVKRWCQSCLECRVATKPRRGMRPPLQPIAVSRPFEIVGVDIMTLPPTRRGNQHVVVFMDYLTKWVHAVPIPNQQTETIAQALIEHVIATHGVPEALLSDRGTNLLSNLMTELCQLMGMKKLNTTAGHPQTDGLVERFNRTLKTMLRKHSDKYGPEWDQYLPYLLFAYRTKVHESTGESPFFLLFGRDARLPTETALSQPRTLYQIDLEDYRTEVVAGLSEAWELARTKVKAQKRQKDQYDRNATAPQYKIGDRVFVYQPREESRKDRKLVPPSFGPYRIIDKTSTDVSVRPVDHPEDEPIFVHMDRIFPCPEGVPDVSYLGARRRRKGRGSRGRGRQRSRNNSKAGEPHHYGLRSRQQLPMPGVRH